MIAIADCTLQATAPHREAQPGQASLRIGFWGTQSRFSQVVLAGLLQHTTLTQVGLPAAAPGASVILRQPPVAPVADELLLVNRYVTPSTAQLAWQQGVPLYEVPRPPAVGVTKWLADQALDVVCVACFPWRIPAALLALPTYGFLNVHPSLLPAYRGPAPLFWQLRDGQQEIGVTVHWMDADFDTGALAAQQALPLPAGATSAELDRLCAATGADLLPRVLQQLAQGVVVRQAQPTGGSQQSWPTAANFQLCSHWSAYHAYTFMRGTDEWQQPYVINIAGEAITLRRALAYQPDRRLDQPVIYNGQEVAVQMQPGVLYALLMNKEEKNR